MNKSTSDSGKYIHKTTIVNRAQKNIKTWMRQEADIENVSHCRALIIDGNQTSRSILAGMLVQIGMRNIDQCIRLSDARKELESRKFDFIFCDYYFSNSSMTGQDLLEDLRRRHILRYSTVFIMLSSEASYQKVAEVVESAVDSYLLRPYSIAALQDRILRIYRSKKVMAPIFSAIELGDFELAAGICLQRFKRRDPYWLYAARIGAEVQIRLGRHNEARELYEAVQKSEALPWAKLGIARVQIEEGQYPAAKRTLESLIGEQPTYIDAYDVMARYQIDKGDFQGAMLTYKNSTQMTPFDIIRLQKNGFLAFLMGNIDVATDMLEKAVRTGIRSKLFDCQALVFLCIIYFSRQDDKLFLRAYSSMEAFYEKSPNSARLCRFYAICKFLKLLINKKISEAITKIREMSSEILVENFDFEASINLTATLAQFSQAEITLEESNTWVSVLAHRFCTSRVSTEMLCMAASNHTNFINLIQESQKYISKEVEVAISHSLVGSYLTTIKALMVISSQTKNAKVIQLASKFLQRHHDEIQNVGSLIEIINDLQRRYCHQGVQCGVGAATSRPAGGVHLRTSS